MSVSYYPKSELVDNRVLKTANLQIPFVVVGNATAASVSLSCDEPSLMYMQSSGVNQITPALDPGENATYTTAVSDSGGILRVLIKLRGDFPTKVCKASATNRITGAGYPGYLGSATGIALDVNGNPYQDIMVVLTLPAFNTSGTIDALFSVDYTVAE